jgi:hypothetical protein
VEELALDDDLKHRIAVSGNGAQIGAVEFGSGRHAANIAERLSQIHQIHA